jgi:hypothetical protein
LIERQQQILCGKCGNKIFPHQRYCRKCANYNRYYDHSHDKGYNIPTIKRSEPTKYTLQLAKALYSTGIDITLEPEIWYTSCSFYTPDILLNNEFIIIEVDGPIHDEPHIQKNDRIRQRALENSGYRVYRFKNQEISNSLEKVTAKVKSIILSQPRLPNSIVNPKIIEINVPENDRMSNISQDFIKAYATVLNSTLIDIGKWNGEYLKEFLSQYNPTPVGNRCAMEKLIFILLGLNLSLKKNDDESIIDFEGYSILFDKCIKIMNFLFGKIGEIELKNAYNITVTNFIKNIIFYGKPRVIHTRLVWIKDYKAVISHIHNFNKYFYKFGITVEEAEVKTECIEELHKIQRSIKEKERIKHQQELTNKQEVTFVDIGQKHFGWLDRWLEEAKSFQWLSEWLGYKGFE